MNDHHGPLLCIADLIETPSPRDTLTSLAKDLSDITRMAAKARALMRSKSLSQPDAHGIFTRLAERASFKEYALATIASVVSQDGLPASLSNKARTLKARTERVDADLQATLLHCYLTISKRLSDIRPLQNRNAIHLPELAKQLQQASQDLAKLLHNVRLVAALVPLPISMKDLEKARADFRHNRAETALAAAQLRAPGNATGDPTTDAALIIAQEAVISIAHTIDTLEVLYKDMEAALNRTRVLPATVH